MAKSVSRNPPAKMAAVAKKRKLIPAVQISRHARSNQSQPSALPAMNVFPFMKLPPEVRNMVYQESLVHDHCGLITCYDDGLIHSNREIYCKISFSLLKTSKQLRIEAFPIFYNENVFTIYASVWNPVETKVAIQPSTPDASTRTTHVNLKHVRHLRIVASHFNIHNSSSDLILTYLNMLHVLRVFARSLPKRHSLTNLLIQSPILESDILTPGRPNLPTSITLRKGTLTGYYNILRPLHHVRGINNVRIQAYNESQRSFFQLLEQRMMRDAPLRPTTTAASRIFESLEKTYSCPSEHRPGTNLFSHYRVEPVMGADLIRGIGPDPARCISLGLMPELLTKAVWVLRGVDWTAFGWEESELSKKYADWTLGIRR